MDQEDQRRAKESDTPLTSAAFSRRASHASISTLDVEARFSSGRGPPGAVGSTEINQETTMNKTLLSLAAATSITVSLLAAPPAEARCWGCAVGVGVAAGVVTGALVGSAIANSYGPAYVVQPGYTTYPSYAVAAPVGCPGGYWARKPVAFDAYGHPIGWSRPHYFCP